MGASHAAIAPHREKVDVTNAMAEPEAPDPEGQLVTTNHLNDVIVPCTVWSRTESSSSQYFSGARVARLDAEIPVLMSDDLSMGDAVYV